MPSISAAQLEQFHRDGVVVIPGLYDVAEYIDPIIRYNHSIIGLVIRRHGLAIKQEPFGRETFDSGYAELIKHDRKVGGEVYDAVKQIPAFMRVVSFPKHDDVFRAIRPGSQPAIASGGYGIRIDNPGEDKFRANWHQDYPSQLRSPDGLVFWSPLRRVTPELGPVEFCLGSHKDGMVPVHLRDPRNPDKTGAYAVTLKDEEKLLTRYPHAAPLSSPGDLVVLDYAVLHASGRNVSNRSRWSMQLRYFNFASPEGMRIGWKGCFAAGVELKAVHPELVIE
ncbi:MAG: phytanoyl-CoA dioxygenase family protein [Planctomyces sp.]